MKNTQAETVPDLATIQQEVELNLPDINKQLILKSFEGAVVYKPEYTEFVDE